jgi:glutamate N-acetyltransferase/amino-acid N-acetyltransferase
MGGLYMTSDNTVKVPGFLANGIAVGIKENGQRDLSLIYSTVPANAAAVFTTNRFKAAPVILDMERISGGQAQAIIANSGNANASTGKDGYDNAVAMSKAVSDGLDLQEDLVLVASTGIIGEKLPVHKIVGGVKELVEGLSENGIPRAEEGIMTTDKFPKIEYRTCCIDNREISICGIAKGAGMIEPNMATMLSFIMTDANIGHRCLRTVFMRGVKRSYNAISVDGCMSTNDTVIILANGIAGNKILKGPSRGLAAFENALVEVMTGLVKSIVRDGEGATKIIEIVVDEARSYGEARKVAYCIANSNLVKTAFFGEDPNWGRIIAAIGSAGIPVSPDSVELYFDGIPLFLGGTGTKQDKRDLSVIMSKDTVMVTVKLGMGKRSFRLYASDLTHEYVTINAHYHT